MVAVQNGLNCRPREPPDNYLGLGKLLPGVLKGHDSARGLVREVEKYRGPSRVESGGVRNPTDRVGSGRVGSD